MNPNTTKSTTSTLTRRGGTTTQLDARAQRPASAELKALLAESLSLNTRKAMKADWRRFRRWCAAHKETPMPATPRAVAEYIKDQLHLKKASTVTRYAASISTLHRMQGFQSPCDNEEVRKALHALRRVKGTRPRQMRPLTLDVLAPVVTAMGTDKLVDLRDRALLLLGYAIGQRGLDLCRLEVSDLTWRRDRLDVLIRRGKTDQTGKGHVVGVVAAPNPALCPARALRAWLKAAQLRSGPVFRRVWAHKGVGEEPLVPTSLWRVVKGRLEAAGIDASDYGAHSLRAGHVTQATRAGASVGEIKKVTGHRRDESVQAYVRDDDTVRGSSAKAIWTPLP